MTQFGKSSSDLPGIVDKVAGALDASKLSFDDYRLAAGQAGGLVGALGYSFDDFNTALAATAPLFDSGSDAGTSFRTFLTSLNAKSEDAVRTMNKLGLSFYEADGSARPLAQIADELQKKMSNLSDRSKNEALQNIFGVDGARTALALMKLGLEGVEDARKKIGAVTADQKLAILLDGEAAATQRVASAWEKLKIVFGEAGIIQFFTAIKTFAADAINVIASAPPWFYKLAAGVAIVVASIGPMILVGTALAKVLLPLLLLRLGPVALGFAALINPVGVVVRLLGQLALQAGAATLMGRLGTAMIGVAGPAGLFIAALSLLIPAIMQGGQVSEFYAKAQGAVSAAQWANADQRKRDLDGAYADKRAGVMRQTEGPAESFIRSLNVSELVQLPDWPAPNGATPGLIDFGGFLVPLLGGRVQRLDRMGNRHRIAITIPPLGYGDEGRIWIQRLKRGKTAGVRMEYPLLDFEPGPCGKPVADGADQGGRLLKLRGLRRGYAVREGQPFSLVQPEGRYLIRRTFPWQRMPAGERRCRSHLCCARRA